MKKALLLMVVFSLAPLAHAQEIVTSGQETEAIIVKSVLDAGTLELSDGRKVRLIGVDAPDIQDSEHNRKNAEEKDADFETLQAFAFVAKTFVKNLVEGKAVMLAYDPSTVGQKNRDPKGRMLAYVWFAMRYQTNLRDEEEELNQAFARVLTPKQKEAVGVNSEIHLLNAEIIKAGYGFVDTRYPFIFLNEFRISELKARENRDGLWRFEPQTYEEILQRGQGARMASVSKTIPPAIREISLQSAQRTFTRLISMKPSDPRAFYERSWIGVDAFHDAVTEANVEDVREAIHLAPDNPACELHLSFLLRLMGRYKEAAQAYERAVDLSAKLDMNESVIEESRKMSQQGFLGDLPGVLRAEGFFQDAYRAALNEEHFLIFMARLKALHPPRHERLQAAVDALMTEKKFKGYSEKYKEQFEILPPNQILYLTQYFQREGDDPEQILALMDHEEAMSVSYKTLSQLRPEKKKN